MNINFSLVQLLAFHFSILINRAKPSSYPLVFNPYIPMVYSKPISDSATNPPMIYPVLSACPARSEEEIKMNINQSLDHKAIFVQEFYPEGKEVEIEDMTRCEKEFEMAVAINRRKKYMRVDLGFEVYFEKSIIPQDAKPITTSPYSSYEPILGGKLPTDYPSLAENKPLSFIWIPKIILRYDASFWNLMSIRYSMHRMTETINVLCKDHNLGRKFLEEEGFYANYSNDHMPENNERIFSAVDIPKESDCQSTEAGCLEMYNLVKPHLFLPNPSSTASCSDLTSIPIWHEVSKQLLDYSEIFLTAISEITSSQINVASGGYEVLSLPLKSERGEVTKLREIYLDSNSLRFPVWRIIYKIVKYQSHNCDHKTDLCWFYMVIVIHNEPAFAKKDRLCPRDKCEEWGWENIQYLNTSATGEKSKHIYCCRLDEIMEGKLDQKIDTYYRDDLNLKYFPVFNKFKGENDYKDMQGEILKQMDILLSKSKSWKI